MTSSGNIAEKPAGGAPLRLCIAGLGLVGRRHADAMERVAAVSLCAVVDPSDEGHAEANRRGVACYANLQAMIEAERPDGVILSTPTKLHVEQARICVEAGIPVLVEKPLADDLVAATELVALAEAKCVALLVGHHRRHNPLIRKAHELIRKGQIGEVRAIQATCWFYKPDGYFDVAPWRKLKGAGPIATNLVHDVDLMRHLCGEVVSVQAQAAPSARGFENEDVAAALLKFENGAVGTIAVSDSIVSPWSWELTAHEYPVYPVTSQSAYQIGGSHASLSIPDLTLWSYGEVRDWWSPITATSVKRDASDPLINQMAHFAAVIRGEEESLVSGREGLRSLAVVDAIQRAAHSGELIKLEHVKGAMVAGSTAPQPEPKRTFMNPAQ